TGTRVLTGETARGRFDDGPAAVPQHRDVLDGRGVLPHLCVHRRRRDDGARGRQQRGGEEVIRDAGAGTGQQVRGGRGDDDELGLVTDPHVLDALDAVEHGRGDRLAAEGLPRGPPHELQGRLRG